MSFLFLLQTMYAAESNKQQHIGLTDTLPSSAQCLTLNQLIEIAQLETKSARTILNLLHQVDKTREHKGTDKTEIVFAVKAKLKYVLTWRKKEHRLCLYYFSTPEHETFNQQIINGGFQFVEEESESPKIAFKIFKKDNLFVKTAEVFRESQDMYLLLIQIDSE
ncbi:MAG: hypothetical protein J0M10_08045 [Chitinophagales bacterium]|nr:hypothetical protein [Chitinophagales bacterium]